MEKHLNFISKDDLLSHIQARVEFCSGLRHASHGHVFYLKLLLCWPSEGAVCMG